MATCIDSINSGQMVTQLSSDVVYPSQASPTSNALYLLNNESDQTVYFTLLVKSQSIQAFDLTVTIYNYNTYQVYGTTKISSLLTNFSFNIPFGNYYVCVRSQIGTYTFNLTPKYIQYSRQITFEPRSNYGFSSQFQIEVKKKPGNCNRPLLYELIDGYLPTGLELLGNGYIYGHLPVLDCDWQNEDLPPSSTWYNQIHDNEYVTSWGRSYRFKVRLSFENDKEIFKETWFWISVLNNFNKTLEKVPLIGELIDDKIASYEEKLANLAAEYELCGVSSMPNQDTSENIKNREFYQYIESMVSDTITEDQITENNNIKEIYDVEQRKNKSDDQLKSELNLTDEELAVWKKYKDSIDTEIYKPNIDLTSDTMIFDETYTNSSMYIPYSESLPISKFSVESLFYDFTINGIVRLYAEQFDKIPFNDDIANLLLILKDSTGFQKYIKEQGINKKYITDAIEREDYTNSTLVELISINTDHYLEFAEDAEYIEDSSNLFNNLKDEIYQDIPWTLYNMYGFSSSFDLRRGTADGN